MEVPHREISIIQSAKLILANLERTLRDLSSTKKQINAALIPAFGIKWDAQIIRGVTADRLREILCSLRNSQLEKHTTEKYPSYGKLRRNLNPSFHKAGGNGG